MNHAREILDPIYACNLSNVHGEKEDTYNNIYTSQIVATACRNLLSNVTQTKIVLNIYNLRYRDEPLQTDQKPKTI